jgi:hypothetical protein
MLPTDIRKHWSFSPGAATKTSWQAFEMSIATWCAIGSHRGGNSMAIAFTLIETAKLNKVNPKAWLKWVLERVADHKINKLEELMPWNYHPEM